MCLSIPTLTHPQVSTDTTKKKIHSLSMELLESRNKLDAKDKVGYIYTSTGHVKNMFFCVSEPGKVRVLGLILSCGLCRDSLVLVGFLRVLQFPPFPCEYVQSALQ